MDLAQPATLAHSFLGCCLPRPAQQACVLRWRPTRFPPPSQESAPASLRLADRWAPPVITLLLRRLSTTTPPLNPAGSFHRPRADLKPSPFFTSVTPPLRCSSCSGEHPSSTASSGSSSSTTSGEHWSALTPARRTPAWSRRALLSVPPRWTRAAPVHAPWTRSTGF
jgi:hypothetical protein